MGDLELAMMLRRPIRYDIPVPAAIRARADALWARPSVASWGALARPGTRAAIRP
jgi:hypothetical protein